MPIDKQDREFLADALNMPVVRLAALLWFVIMAALLTTGCRSRRPPPDRSSAPPALVQKVDTSAAKGGELPPPAPPHFWGIGAAARLRAWADAERARQGIAPVPRKLKAGRGAVLTAATAPGATATAAAATGKYAAAASDSAALVVAARGAQAALATDGATITQTPPARVGWLAGLKAWLVPSMAAAGLAWLVFFVWRRRRNYPA